MKFSARIIAALLCVVMLVGLCACHKKGETVMTVGETAIPSGLYIAFTNEAFNEFTQKVNEDIGETAAQNLKAEDYFDYDLEDKDAVTWIQDRTKELCQEYAVVRQFVDQNKITLTAEEADYLDSYVDYYWDNGYKEFFEQNGVSKDTYKDLLEFFQLRGKVFNFYYDEKDEETGKGGLQTVPMTELLTQLAKDYVLLETMSISTEVQKEDGTTVSKTDVEITEAKSKLDGYAVRINNGSATFKEIQDEYAKEQGQETESQEQETATSTDADELKSIYPESATLYSKNDTNDQGQADTANYEKYSAMTKAEEFAGFGKAYVVNEGNCYTLIIFYDLSKDEYYADQNRGYLLQELRGDTFDKLLADKAAELTTTVDAKLVKYYSPKKLSFDNGEE